MGPLLSQMARTPQNPAYHGEGNVLNHTKLVCQALTAMEEFRRLEERKRQIVFLAALLHLGKLVPPKRFEARQVDWF